jgi:dipeptidyl aminopeptidase/acylaminoacyl peptidase
MPYEWAGTAHDLDTGGRSMKRIVAAVVTAAALAAALVAAGTTSASFPGPNGPIVFQKLGEVWVVNADGSGAHKISPGGATRDPAISPDGRMVAYEQGLDLVVSNIDGTGVKNVTIGGHNDQFPAWAPDGKKLVFVRADAEDLFIVNVDGTGLTQLTKDGGAFSELEPDWSPDGSAIAFDRPGCDEKGGQVCIFKIAPDGSNLQNLTPEETPAECPDINPGNGPRGNSSHASWSPDGSKIAFEGSSYHCQNGSPIAGHDIWVMNADGSGKTDVLPDANDDTYDEQPSWSPDGRQIAFQSDRLNGGGNGNRDLVVMPAGGGNVTRVLAGDSSGSDYQPSWGIVPPPPSLIGTPGNDLLNGTSKDDVMKGLGGDDIINALQGNDSVDGGDGKDKLTGSEGNDKLTGGRGNDTLIGATGKDKLNGGAGNDKLDGGPGPNTYSGGAGNDTINSANGKRETVSCGSGRDSVRADRSDRVKGCEKVRRTK